MGLKRIHVIIERAWSASRAPSAASVRAMTRASSWRPSSNATSSSVVRSSPAAATRSWVSADCTVGKGRQKRWQRPWHPFPRASRSARAVARSASRTALRARSAASSAVASASRRSRRAASAPLSTATASTGGLSGESAPAAPVSPCTAKQECVGEGRVHTSRGKAANLSGVLLQ